MATKTHTPKNIETWSKEDLLVYIDELIYLLDEADELLEPREDFYADKWREMKDSYRLERDR